MENMIQFRIIRKLLMFFIVPALLRTGIRVSRKFAMNAGE